jgi:hypothetical protein
MKSVKTERRRKTSESQLFVRDKMLKKKRKIWNFALLLLVLRRYLHFFQVYAALPLGDDRF